MVFARLIVQVLGYVYHRVFLLSSEAMCVLISRKRQLCFSVSGESFDLSVGIGEGGGLRYVFDGGCLMRYPTGTLTLYTRR